MLARESDRKGTSDMRVETQFSIFLINTPGVLAQVTEALARAEVSIVALSLSDSGEHGVLRIVCDNAQRTREVLHTEHDRWTETEVVIAKLQDRPGAFAETAKILADAGVNITYAYCTGGFETGTTYAVFKVPDVRTVEGLLT